MQNTLPGHDEQKRYKMQSLTLQGLFWRMRYMGIKYNNKRNNLISERCGWSVSGNSEGVLPVGAGGTDSQRWER